MTGRHRYSPFLLLFGLIWLAGCVHRDDTTATVRHIIADHMEMDLDSVTAESTLGDLGCSEIEVAKLVVKLMEHFSIGITSDDIDALAGDDESWESVTVLDIANFVRKANES